MATITLKGNTIHTSGNLPAVGSKAPEFTLTRSDLTETKLSDYAGKKVILNIFPSLDTSVCAASVRRFNAEASKHPNTVVLCISRDLPYAHKRFCTTEGLDKVITASQLRDDVFGKNYGLVIADGPMSSLLSRVVIIVDEKGMITYTQQVPEIAQEPDYDAVMAAL